MQKINVLYMLSMLVNIIQFSDVIHTLHDVKTKDAIFIFKNKQ